MDFISASGITRTRGPGGIFATRGIDPLRIAAETARSVGIELHASYRVAGFHFPAPIYDSWNAEGFYLDHPELRCVATRRQSGAATCHTPTPRLGNW